MVIKLTCQSCGKLFKAKNLKEFFFCHDCTIAKIRLCKANTGLIQPIPRNMLRMMEVSKEIAEIRKKLRIKRMRKGGALRVQKKKETKVNKDFPSKEFKELVKDLETYGKNFDKDKK